MQASSASILPVHLPCTCVQRHQALQGFEDDGSKRPSRRSFVGSVRASLLGSCSSLALVKDDGDLMKRRLSVVNGAIVISAYNVSAPRLPTQSEVTREVAPSREQRAEVRLLRAHRLCDDGGSYLRQRSIAPVTEQRYHDGTKKLIEFASARNLELRPGESLERALELLANVMFFKGCGAAEFRYVAWGYAWVRCLTLSKLAYPRTHASLRGWRKAAPEVPRLPLTWELLLLAISVMLDWHREQPETNVLQAACALAIQWDLYLRPSEVLELECADVAENATRNGALAVIARAAPDSKEGSRTDLIGTRRGLPRSKPAKTTSTTAQSSQATRSLAAPGGLGSPACCGRFAAVRPTSAACSRCLCSSSRESVAPHASEWACDHISSSPPTARATEARPRTPRRTTGR